MMTTHVPILDWLPKYQLRQAFLADIMAGITIGVMSIPQGEVTRRRQQAGRQLWPPLSAGSFTSLIQVK